MLKNTFYLALFGTTLVLTLLLLILPTPEKKSAHEALDTEVLLIENATIFNGEKFLQNMDIEINGGIISAMGKNLVSLATLRIDASGKTLIPGLIDAHTHSFGDALQLALNFGVTTQVDMFTAPSLLSNQIVIRKNYTQNEQADLFSAGMLATVEGGHGTQFGIPIDTLRSPSQAEDWVGRRIQEGSDFIKLVYMPYSDHFNSLDRPTSAAIIQAAHDKGLLVVAHISSQRAAKELLEDGIDGFVHIFADQKISQEVLDLAKRNNIFVIPTLSVIASAAQVRLADELAADSAIAKYLQSQQAQQLLSGFGEHKIPGFDLPTAIHNTNRLHQAGITILAGSDAPNPGTSYGVSIHQELELLTQAGLSNSQAINAASINVINAFRLTAADKITQPRGRLAIGAKADFIILNSSPQQDIKATRLIDRIYKNGLRVERKTLKQASQSDGTNRQLSSPILSNFSSGLTTADQFSWAKTDDSMASGSSIATIGISNQVLKVNAAVAQGFILPWAGAAVFTSSTTDISNYKAVSFRIRGTAGQYQAMIFSGPQAGSPPSQSFSVTSKWQMISLALSDFRGLDKTQLSGLAIVAGPKTGEFEYYIDDVKLLK